MSDTHNLGLPLLEAGQAQKHVTVNEALRLIDAVVQIAVSAVTNAPPASPAEGERHIVGAAPSGVWSGHAGAIALRRDGVWVFVAPQEGFVAFNRATGRLLVFAGVAGWLDLFLDAALDQVARIGIATASDATNRLAVRAPAILLTAVPAADGGSGDAQVKINKEAAADTATLLFQRGYSGRAEIGLAGDDHLRLKVSADGAAWSEAATISNATGHWGIGGAAPDSHVAPSLITGLIATLGEALLAATAIYNADNPVPFYVRRARGTPAAPAAIAAGDRFFGFYGGGYHAGGGWSPNAVAFQGAAEEAFTATAHGTRVDFATTPVGGTARRTIVQFRANGTLHLTPMSAAPSSPENGQIYYDSSTARFRGYAGGAWVDLH